MLELKPITDAQASSEVTALFSDIKNILGVQTVPYYFQIVANFPNLLSLIWLKIKPIVTSPEFEELVERKINQTVVNLRRSFASEIDQVEDVSQASPDEIPALFALIMINLKLFLVSLIVREAIKGLDIKNKLLLEKGNPLKHEEFIVKGDLEIGSTNIASEFANLISKERLEQTLGLLQSLFTKIQQDQLYLELRLDLERQLQQEIRTFPSQFIVSYREVIEAIYNRPGAPEVVYLIHDVFPGTLPHQFLFSILLFLTATSSSPLLLESPEIKLLE